MGHSHLSGGGGEEGGGRRWRGEEGGGRGGLRGIGGGMTSHLEFWVQMFTICAHKSPEFEFGFGKLLGEIEFNKFLRNLKYLVVFEVRA